MIVVVVAGPGQILSGEIGEIMKGITEVKDLDTTEVSDRIERLAVDTVLQILQKNEAFEFVIPNRAASNQKYIEAQIEFVLEKIHQNVHF